MAVSSKDGRVIDELIDRMTLAWKYGEGESFGSCFTRKAHFVAFDGTILVGPSDIASYHQDAFAGPLQGTSLQLSLEESRELSPDVLLFFTIGGIHSGDSKVGVTGESIQTYVLMREEGTLLIEAFQNTRLRPITNQESMSCWKDFDTAWNEQLSLRRQ